MTTVHTVLGAIETSELGNTLMHEHVFVLTPEIQQQYPAGWDEDVRVFEAEVDEYRTHEERVTQRKEMRCLLGGLDPGNTRGREDIAFGDLIPCDQIERFSLEPNLSACNGSSFTERLR